MSRAFSLLSLFALLFFFSSASAQCSPRTYRQIRRLMVFKARTVPGLAAAWLRAGFHDCIVANKAKPGSGCNGSLRFELDDFRNARLQIAVDELAPFVGLGCFNWADGFMAATEAALRAGRIRLPAGVKLVDLANPRAVSEEADAPSAANPPSITPQSLFLPSPFLTFDGLVKFYADRGMNAADLVSSSVIGHAIGGFVDPINGGPVKSFTGRDVRITTRYAKNLFRRLRRGSNRPGFNTLESDESLIKGIDGITLLGQYANGRAGKTQCVNDFMKFLVKMAALSPATVSV